MENERANPITETIIGAAIAVHKHLGPGLLESTHEACLAFEMADRGLSFEEQKDLPVVHRGVRIACADRMDFLVEDTIVAELKAVATLLLLHEAQLLAYLK